MWLILHPSASDGGSIMNTVVIGAATSSTSSSATISWAGTVRIRQCADFAEATCAAAGRHLHRAVSRRKEALIHWLEEFVLEMLAAIVLIAIFMIVTDPATGKDC
jgi:hypothetical protein